MNKAIASHFDDIIKAISPSKSAKRQFICMLSLSSLSKLCLTSSLARMILLACCICHWCVGMTPSPSADFVRLYLTSRSVPPNFGEDVLMRSCLTKKSSTMKLRAAIWLFSNCNPLSLAFNIFEITHYLKLSKRLLQ